MAFPEEGQEAGRSTAFPWDSLGRGAMETGSGFKLSPDLPRNRKDFFHNRESERCTCTQAAGPVTFWQWGSTILENTTNSSGLFNAAPAGTVQWSLQDTVGASVAYLICNHAHP